MRLQQESLLVKGMSTAAATRINNVVQLGQEWIIRNRCPASKPTFASKRTFTVIYSILKGNVQYSGTCTHMHI